MQYPWLAPLVVLIGLLAALALAWVRLLNLPRVPAWAQRANVALALRLPQLDALHLPGGAVLALAGAGVAALLLAPAVWTAATAGTVQGMLPSAGPSPIRTLNLDGYTFRVASQNFGGLDAQQVPAQMLAYLQAHRDGAKYLVATLNANSAAPIIIATGDPVMAIGGFSGTDPILTADEFAKLVASGQVRYVLLQGAGRGGRRFGGFPGFPGFGGNSAEEGRSGAFPSFGGRANSNTAVVAWIQKNCTVVPAAQWGGSTTAFSGSPFGGFAPPAGNAESPSFPFPGVGGRSFSGGFSQQLYACHA